MHTFSRRAAALVAASLLATACGGDADAGDPTAQGAVDEGATGTSDEPAAEAADEPATEDDGEAGGGPSGSLDGAGATFPTPVFEEWIFDYAEVNPGASINYQSIGSGGGIEQFLSQTVDFGSSERVLSEDDLQLAADERGCDPIEIPVVFGAVTIAYDEPELEELVLSGEVIADIFERRITMWNDPAIAELNPDAELPEKELIPVHRSDGSGTTSVFTKYLDADTDTWTLGEGTEVQWPSGTVGGEGNEGVSAGITQNDGGIGYINQAYALELGLQTASVINEDGNAVQPTLEATSAALATIDIPDDFRFDILGVGGDGYPIAGTNWIFAWECGYDVQTADLLKDFWTWAVENGDDLALELGYAPLDESVKPDVRAAIERINSQN
ncbi:phosphate ABC transporter substrate-binding protein PstS [Egicoccus sp. AB-alg2]|uniref:phosphate ABC transporter substrate-binding protein PstS n=1 Tax=Egicoccus sp. AB-alg2 TaxID=3242693 RepID=UPI00359D7EF1